MGDFDTPMREVVARDWYDNHPAVSQNEATIKEKFTKEEWQSYHIHFLRFLMAFVYGLILNPIQWAFDKGKGRICIDCTNGLDQHGSENTYIPSLLADNPDECPPIFYQYALNCYVCMLYRLRVLRPGILIGQHADDIDAAFRQLLYTPELAIAYAYIFIAI
jgi:hypothetical protein